MNFARESAALITLWAKVGLRSPALICASIAFTWWVAMFAWFVDGGLASGPWRLPIAVALGLAGWAVTDLAIKASHTAWQQHHERGTR